MYHLDGIGQLPHLDSLLTINELDAVQWVPGDGKPKQGEWPHVYQKIYMAGKKIQIWEGIDNLESVINAIGSGKGIWHGNTYTSISAAEIGKAKALLSKYGIES